jgi:hypothetical protein
MRCIGLDVPSRLLRGRYLRGRTGPLGRSVLDRSGVRRTMGPGAAGERGRDPRGDGQRTRDRPAEPFARVVLARRRSRARPRCGRRPTRSTRTLATLLAGGFLPEVWIVDEATRVMRRRISRRAQLIKARTKEEPDPRHAHPELETPPVSDLFGVRGLAWLVEQELPDDEREPSTHACGRSPSSTARSASSRSGSPRRSSPRSTCAVS